MIEQVEVFHKETIPQKYIDEFHSLNKEQYNLTKRNEIYKSLFSDFLEEYPDTDITLLEFKKRIFEKDVETISLKEIELDYLTGEIDDFEFYTTVEFTDKYLLLDIEDAIHSLEQHSHVWFKEDDIYEYLQKKFSNLEMYDLYVKYVLCCDLIYCKPLVTDPELLYKIFHDKFSEEYKQYIKKLERLYTPKAVPIEEHKVDLSFSTSLSDLEINRIILTKTFYQNKENEEEYWTLFQENCQKSGFKVIFTKQEFHDLFVAFKTSNYTDLIEIYSNKFSLMDFSKHNQEMMLKHCYKMYSEDCLNHGLSVKSYNEFKTISLNKIREVSKV